MSGIDKGPRCRRCLTDEAGCARRGGCCPSCSHTFGEPAALSRLVTRLCTECGTAHTRRGDQLRARCDRCHQAHLEQLRAEDRCSDPKAGTDTGYYRHLRITRTQPCSWCRAAHSRAERERRQRNQVSA